MINNIRYPLADIAGKGVTFYFDSFYKLYVIRSFWTTHFFDSRVYDTTYLYETSMLSE